MHDKNLDGFICPSSGTPAFKHYESKDLAMVITINVIANLLDYCSGVIPVTKVSKEDLKEEYDDPNFPNDHFVQETRKTLQGSEGLPVGIQVCTRTYQEEKCLAITMLVDKALKEIND